MTFLSFLAGLLGMLGAAGAYFKWFAAPFSFYLCLGALIVIALNLPVSLVRFIRLGRRGVSFAALLFGLLAAGALAFVFKAAVEHPLTDISSDPFNPPTFRHPATTIPAPGMEAFLEPTMRFERPYDPGLAEKQQQVYPGLRGVFVALPPERALEFVKAVAEKHPGWRMVQMNVEGTQGIEFEVTHPIFNTVEDFVVAPALSPPGCILRFRSRSRFGFTDFGSNAKRIREFAQALVDTGRAMTPPLRVELQ